MGDAKSALAACAATAYRGRPCTFPLTPLGKRVASPAVFPGSKGFPRGRFLRLIPGATFAAFFRDVDDFFTERQTAKSRHGWVLRLGAALARSPHGGASRVPQWRPGNRGGGHRAP